jgi:hypothetical protein
MNEIALVLGLLALVGAVAWWRAMDLEETIIMFLGVAGALAMLGTLLGMLGFMVALLELVFWGGWEFISSMWRLV